MGITQAAVSQYLSFVRGKDRMILKTFPKIKEKALKIAEHISAGKPKGEIFSYIYATYVKEYGKIRNFVCLTEFELVIKHSQNILKLQKFWESAPNDL